MFPSEAPSPAQIDLYYSDKDLFMHLEKINDGFPPPENVCELNPYHYKPANLPVNIWFLIQRNEKKETKSSGHWKAKGEAYEIFSNSLIIGWRSTLEFFEGQAPHDHKTDWVMQEYWITQKRLSEDNEVMGARSLCRVFLVQNADVANHSTLSNAESSSGRQQANETGNLAVIERLPEHTVENDPEMDYISRGDFLELMDLDTLASPSSSSDSSCLTMSSDECFDALALLQDLEKETNDEPVQKDADCKFSVAASIKPTEVVIYPALSGTLDKPPKELVPRTERSIPGSALCGKISDSPILKNACKSQNPDFRNEGTSSNSEKKAAATAAVPRKEKKASIGRKKSLKKKYFCFMPF